MNYIKTLAKIASRSPHLRFKHASILTKGGAIIAADYNGNEFHAEIGALKKLWPNKIKGSVMLNIRITKTGLGLSRPCKNCWSVMKAMGVAKVIYSGRNGQFITERL
jgi:deoxycytidylate deaminase